ncbi:MAG: GerMN domain-containing protein [Acidobacteria bacterium]|nr:GerMN domain-containing protein [Acidobacteriota bacterium]
MTALLFLLALAMAIYVWQLRRREVLNSPPPATAQHVAPPAAGPLQQATLWVAYDKEAALHRERISIPLTSNQQQRAEELLRALMNRYAEKNSPHPIAAASELHDVYLVDPGLAVLDLNATFVDSQTSGVLAEELTLASIMETLTANIPSILRVKILVDGHERETLAGHADLSGAYDVAEVSELAKQLTTR